MCKPYLQSTLLVVPFTYLPTFSCLETPLWSSCRSNSSLPCLASPTTCPAVTAGAGLLAECPMLVVPFSG